MVVVPGGILAACALPLGFQGSLRILHAMFVPAALHEGRGFSSLSKQPYQTPGRFCGSGLVQTNAVGR